MLMDSVYYLPKEVVNIYNYPELSTEKDNIESIYNYAQLVEEDVKNYINNNSNKINVNIEELTQYIILCRETCNILSNSPSVCFDVIIELRQIQFSLQNLRQLYEYNKDEYFVESSESTSGGLI